MSDILQSMLRRTVLGLVLASSSVAYADRPDGVCVQVAVDFVPTDALQIVAWLEKPDGTYVDTVYITQKTGRYGLGNRPGRSDFNTGSSTADAFPYGRREQTFPVWAHRHGIDFPLIVFQNGDEDNLSHPLGESSVETNPPYCRPLRPEEAGFDTGTCASMAYSDKGKFADGMFSGYPPRADVERNVNKDSSDVDMYRALNPFDAVTRATPLGGMPATATWAAPQSLDYGDYVMFVEASKTYDFNATYNTTSFPAPTDIPWSGYGAPWRGQPSVVYQVPFSIASTPTTARTASYAGYGDPTGATGVLHAPDATITTDTPGSGASRMQLVSDGSDMYRVRVRAIPEIDQVAPAAIAEPTLIDLRSRSARLVFAPTGDDGTAGVATGYEVRVRSGSPITDANFNDSMPVAAQVILDDAGNPTIDIAGLLPETDYDVGIRAYDNCFNHGPVTSLAFTTLARDVAEVDWCFVATAAYGSLMANDVQMLRQFRDVILERSVLGELFVTAYYTFGPAAAAIVGESDLLRASARAGLAPVIEAVRGLGY
jgi:hypothetical protein